MAYKMLFRQQFTLKFSPSIRNSSAKWKENSTANFASDHAGLGMETFMLDVVVGNRYCQRK